MPSLWMMFPGVGRSCRVCMQFFWAAHWSHAPCGVVHTRPWPVTRDTHRGCVPLVALHGLRQQVISEVSCIRSSTAHQQLHCHGPSSHPAAWPVGCNSKALKELNSTLGRLKGFVHNFCVPVLDELFPSVRGFHEFFLRHLCAIPVKREPQGHVVSWYCPMRSQHAAASIFLRSCACLPCCFLCPTTTLCLPC